MPTYEYLCEGRCQKIIEIKHSMKQEFKKCFECAGPLRRLISKPRFIFTNAKLPPVDATGLDIRTENEIVWKSRTD